MKQSMAQSNWKAKKFKKKGKNDNSGRTPGKDKGFNCRATTLERYMAKRSRSYKHPRYGLWLQVKPGIHKPTRKMS